MTDKVLFLCYPLNAETGLVFPSEQECGFPGMFVVEENQGQLSEQYTFEAIQNSQELILTLQKRENHIFYVRSQVGIFYFRTHPLKETYVGKKSYLQTHNPFWLLEPLNSNQLEAVCQNNGFYFVGSVED
jgi:hypothetical protein